MAAFEGAGTPPRIAPKYSYDGGSLSILVSLSTDIRLERGAS